MSTNDNTYKFAVFELEEIETEEVKTKLKQVGVRDFVRKYLIKKREIGEDVLEKELVGFVTQLQNIMSKLNLHDDKFDIETIDINAQISAEGKIGFMGTGIGITGTGGITFTFRKR